MKELDEVDRLILSVARDLFFAQGIRKTEMKDIAAHVQIGRSTLYRRFTNKDVIAFYIARDILVELGGSIDVPDDGGNGFERFAAYARSYVQSLVSHIPEIRFLDEFDQIFTGNYPDEELSSIFRMPGKERGSFAYHFLQEGMADGSVRLPADAAYMSSLFTQSVMGTAQRILPREAHYIEEHGYGREFLFSLVELYLDAIRT